MALEADVSGVRVAELVATLSYAADLGLGHPVEHCMRQTVIALRLADLVDAPEPDREATYYLGLRMNSYCHADAAEQAKWFGDDLTLKSDGIETLGMSTPQVIAFLLRRVGSHGTPLDRARRLAAFPLYGARQMSSFVTTHSALGPSSPNRWAWTTPYARRSHRPTSSGTARASRGTCAGRTSACRPGWSTWPVPSRCSADGTVPRPQRRWRERTAGASSTRP